MIYLRGTWLNRKIIIRILDLGCFYPRAYEEAVGPRIHDPPAVIEFERVLATLSPTLPKGGMDDWGSLATVPVRVTEATLSAAVDSFCRTNTRRLAPATGKFRQIVLDMSLTSFRTHAAGQALLEGRLNSERAAFTALRRKLLLRIGDIERAVGMSSLEPGALALGSPVET